MSRPNNNEANVAGPSIALLQERFRQLERAREQREDKTLKLFPEPHQVINISNKNYLPANQGLQRDQWVVFSSRTHEKDHNLSLGLSLNNNSSQTGLRVMKTQKFWSGFSPKRKFGNSEVDTSLHL
ncbi:unnamed protein product [Withania somnifera]